MKKYLIVLISLMSTIQLYAGNLNSKPCNPACTGDWYCMGGQCNAPIKSDKQVKDKKDVQLDKVSSEKK